MTTLPDFFVFTDFAFYWLHYYYYYYYWTTAIAAAKRVRRENQTRVGMPFLKSTEAFLFFFWKVIRFTFSGKKNEPHSTQRKALLYIDPGSSKPCSKLRQKRKQKQKQKGKRKAAQIPGYYSSHALAQLFAPPFSFSAYFAFGCCIPCGIIPPYTHTPINIHQYAEKERFLFC